MEEESKKKFQVITVVYWILLTYIIAALVWWFFSLYTQNEAMYHLRRQQLQASGVSSTAYQEALSEINEQRKRNIAKYIGEGGTFLFLILFGAAYVYRSVRRQFRTQQQQQNFVMAITHELKTPISVARLNLETLQRHKLDEEKRTKLLQMTMQETLRLDNLINNILISSQLEGRSYRISKEEINFSDLVNNVVTQFAARYGDRKLIRKIEEDVDINGDPLLLKLMVSNLLENANKYSQKDRVITIELAKRSDSVRLSVKDEGCGIKNEEKKNVFRKFYRIGNEQPGGTKKALAMDGE